MLNRFYDFTRMTRAEMAFGMRIAKAVPDFTDILMVAIRLVATYEDDNNPPQVPTLKIRYGYTPQQKKCS